MTKYYINKFKNKTSVQIGYARVSSSDNRQELGLEVQKEALKDCDIIFIEKDSGGKTDRPRLNKAMKIAKALADSNIQVSFVVYKLDRLTRKMFQLSDIIQELTTHSIQLKSLQENIETNSLTGKFFCLILGYVAEWELESIHNRTKDGLRKARERGVKLGNKGISKELENQIIQNYLLTNTPIRKLSKNLKISTATIYSVLHRNNIRTNRIKKHKNR
ncbi:recombinase family protein [Streptococcus suis]|uniref:Recombinase family protein n=1 Tax=Streptococcus suis TaxID=1307 RepID=A0A9X4MSH3_STRSU|nr:recombinase family protein [Streptococcus suis]MBY5026027.1 recombinase family protein [Streptococcus suis]MDG4527480.1 recombinase family protein [Streptococcus suis]MDG4529794.1 recombinase family protein [Streptococcus suis]QZT16371.1 recombinase family protein [Streptococcus suis]